MSDGWGTIIVLAVIGGVAYFACRDDSTSINNSNNNGNSKQIEYSARNLMASGPNGEVYIIDKQGTRLTFATKSGVIYKQVDLNAPDSFVTYKSFQDQIHNTRDSLSVDAEWIGDRVYWRIETSGLNTRSANSIRLSSWRGTPLILLCEKCNWIPIFDSETGKTTNYSVEGNTPNVPIDVWNEANSLSYRAVAIDKGKSQ